MLRFMIDHESSIKLILGNHEIFAIAMGIDAYDGQRSHTLQGLLRSEDKLQLITWLRKQPLLIRQGQNIFVHAGILPAISIEEAQESAENLSAILKSDRAPKFLRRYYQRTPSVWKNNKKPKRHLRLSLAYLTLLRMCRSPEEMDLKYNGGLDGAPKDLFPWFSLRDDPGVEIYFGHWAALGIYHHRQYHCLDSGCVWGGKLSALRLEDQKLFQVDHCE